MAGKIHADPVVGEAMGIIAAEIVIRVVVGAARISGTSSPSNLALLLLPLLLLRNSVHVSIILDKTLRLEHRNSSRCKYLIMGRSGCRRHRNNSNPANFSRSNRMEH